MSEARRGFFAMVACCVVWGLSGIYYKLLSNVPALEVIAHRTIWSAVVFGLILGLQGRMLGTLKELRSFRTIGILTASAILISINWAGFVFAVHKGWALDASLGYYIFPLIAVLLGVFALREKLSRLQKYAVAIAALGVALLTYGLGTAPWISLLLATTFSLYGLLKKGISVGPVASVFLEVLLIAPIGFIWLAAKDGGVAGIVGWDWQTMALLIGSGPMTAVPLMLFSYGAKRIDFATVGLVHYINPTLQFLVAVFLFGEVFTGWHGVSFALIWTALTFYSAAAYQAVKRQST